MTVAHGYWMEVGWLFFLCQRQTLSSPRIALSIGFLKMSESQSPFLQVKGMGESGCRVSGSGLRRWEGEGGNLHTTPEQNLLLRTGGSP